VTPLIEAGGPQSVRYEAAPDGLDLVAEPGQVLAVLGPNGGRWMPGQCPDADGRRETPQARAPAQSSGPRPDE
jgi:hypothetical protein